MGIYVFVIEKSYALKSKKEKVILSYINFWVVLKIKFVS